MIESSQPSGILRPYIQHYFIVETDGTTGFLPKQRIYPSGYMTLVFHYGSPSKFQKKNADEYTEPHLVICGQQTHYYDLALSGKTGMIITVFKPHGVKSFFPFPITELSNENLSLDDVVNHEARELEDKLIHSSNNEERIRKLEEFLIKRLVRDHDFERIQQAVKLIEVSKGHMKTWEVAAEVCLGIKQFERTFSKYVGLNPKKFASIVRFQHVLQMKRRLKSSSMFQLAFDNGYFDPSHFSHDFKSLTGVTPGEFFKNKT